MQNDTRSRCFKDALRKNGDALDVKDKTQVSAMFKQLTGSTRNIIYTFTQDGQVERICNQTTTETRGIGCRKSAS